MDEETMFRLLPEGVRMRIVADAFRERVRKMTNERLAALVVPLVDRLDIGNEAERMVKRAIAKAEDEAMATLRRSLESYIRGRLRDGGISVKIAFEEG